MDRDTLDPVKSADSLADLHHALMNPLTVVVGYAQLLADRPDLDQTTREQARRVLEEARECVRILENARRQRTTAEAKGPARDQAEAPSTRARVLVVDDEPVILRLTAEVLSPEFEVTTCEDAKTAIEKMRFSHYDAVLLDLNLGGRVSGRDFYQSLMELGAAEHVVFVTGGVVSEEEQEFLATTGRECVNKPFSINVLRDVVRRVARPSSPKTASRPPSGSGTR